MYLKLSILNLKKSCVDVFILQPSSQIQNCEYENEENTMGGYEVIVDIHYPIISYCYLICIFFKNLKLGQMSREERFLWLYYYISDFQFYPELSRSHPNRTPKLCKWQ